MKPIGKWSRKAKVVWLLALVFPIVGTFLHIVLYYTWYSFFQPLPNVVIDIFLYGPGYLIILFAYIENRSALLGRILLLTGAYMLMHVPLVLFGLNLACGLYGSCL